MTGLFVTFEGGEGSGKTTQIERLAAILRVAGRAVVVTREPGGSLGADALRHVLLSGAAQRFGHRIEAILFAAARADHVEALIRPSLEREWIVLCDRFHDSTRVYQGLVPDVDFELLNDLEEATVDGFYPDITFILDLPADEGLRRAAQRRGERQADRFEKESVELHEVRRQAFLAIAAAEPDRCVVVDASRPVPAVAAEIATHLSSRIGLDLRRLARELPGDGP